jgi:hypothetical protein
MQIRSIVIYSRENRVHAIKFDLGRLNIVSGKSGTGKSALIAIVDYCLGARRLAVPAGIIQQKVSWYGLILDFDGERLFVARPSEAVDRAQSSKFHIAAHEGDDPPPIEELRAAHTRQELLDRVGARLGLSSALIPRADGTADRKQLSFRSGLIYCFQKQNEIANPDLFFHRQSDPGVAQQLRDTLPFYLGAISPTIIEAQSALRAKRRRLREIERELAKNDAIAHAEDADTSFLLDQSNRLLPGAAVANLLEARQRLMDFTIAGLEDASPEERELAQANRRLNELSQERADLVREVEALEQFGRDQDTVELAVNEQRRRLVSLNLLSPEGSGETCPVCEEVRSRLPPTASDLRTSVERLHAELSLVSSDQRELREAVAERRSGVAALDVQIGELRRTIARRREEELTYKELLERRSEAARISGMLDMFLRVTAAGAEERRPALEMEARALLEEIQELENEADLSATRARTATFLGGIGQTITQWAQAQNLEYAEGLLTFDPQGPRLVSETESGTVPFYQFGSGKNWVWYHLLGHLALHKWFYEKNRPVPRFLMLDQPSQVYFPHKTDDDDEFDWDEVRKIYTWLISEVARLRGGLQVIVADHARFDDDASFMSHLKHDWSDGAALIPAEWL